MKNVLRIQTGAGATSATREVGQVLVDRLRASGASIVERDLVASPLPHLDPAFVAAMFERPDDPALALSDTLIAELVASDVLVLEVPMYNFTVPSVLKAWIDHVVRAGKTFQYDATGVRGLLENRRAYLVLGEGGFYQDGPFKPYDHLEPYLRAMLGFLGLTEIETVLVDRLNMGQRAESIASARVRVEQLSGA